MSILASTAATSRSYHLRPRQVNHGKSKAKSIHRKAFTHKIQTIKKSLIRYREPTPPPLSTSKRNSNHNKNSKRKTKKIYKEPTAIQEVLWVPPKKIQNEDDWETEIRWFGLPKTYGRSITKLLDDDVVPELAIECQMRHHEHEAFSRWFISRTQRKRPDLRVGDLVYDINDRKYFIISEMPANNQLNVWRGYENYFVAWGYEMDPYARLSADGDDGVNGEKYYALFKNEIVKIDNLSFFYFKQMAKDSFQHLIADKLRGQFRKKTKAKPLRFFETLMGTVWKHYIKTELDDNNVDYQDSCKTKKWTLKIDQANSIFPDVDVGGSLWERTFGNKRIFVDDIEFVFHVNTNKLRIYAVIFVLNTKTKALDGLDVSAR
eukprot:788601_1